MDTEVTFAPRSRPLVVFPVALVAVVMCGLFVALAPRPGQAYRADARGADQTIQASPASPEMPLAHVEGGAER